MVWLLLVGRLSSQIREIFLKSASMFSQNHLADAQVARYFPKISCLGSCARANCEYVLAVLSRRLNFCLLSSRKSSSELTATLYFKICDVLLAALSRSFSSDWPASYFSDFCESNLAVPSHTCSSDWSATFVCEF